MSPLLARLSHVGVRYGTTDVVQDVSFTVEAAQCWVILGPNGAGKSTVARVLAGCLSLRLDSVEFFGRAPHLGGLGLPSGADARAARTPMEPVPPYGFLPRWPS